MDFGEFLKPPKKSTLEDKLYLVKFKVDKEPHLRIIDPNVCTTVCKEQGCLYVCPVQNYTLQDGKVNLSWEGCVECGSCRVTCKFENIDWKYPRGGFGVLFRLG